MIKNIITHIIVSSFLILFLVSCGEEKEKKYEINYPNGNIKETGLKVKNEKGEFQREGEWTVYYENGNLKRKSSYKNGKLNGPYETLFANGQKKENGGIMLSQ